MDTVMELLQAMALVRRLCRELDFPPVIEKSAAQRVILTVMERSSKEDAEAIMAAFDFADTIQ
jgi:hypothetical protein